MPSVGVLSHTGCSTALEGLSCEYGFSGIIFFSRIRSFATPPFWVPSTFWQHCILGKAGHVDISSIPSVMVGKIKEQCKSNGNLRGGHSALQQINFLQRLKGALEGSVGRASAEPPAADLEVDRLRRHVPASLRKPLSLKLHITSIEFALAHLAMAIGIHFVWQLDGCKSIETVKLAASGRRGAPAFGGNRPQLRSGELEGKSSAGLVDLTSTDVGAPSAQVGTDLSVAAGKHERKLWCIMDGAASSMGNFINLTISTWTISIIFSDENGPATGLGP
ncbi:hypothetical protein FB451DRAFT_1172536 [Mycena latifolia]|nr:hypothetical protein FB451DRAFT_1172536 [Mycena latifolia]